MDDVYSVVECFFVVGINVFYLGYLCVVFFWKYFVVIGIVLFCFWIVCFLNYFILFIEYQQVEIVYIDFVYVKFLCLVEFVVVWCEDVGCIKNDVVVYYQFFYGGIVVIVNIGYDQCYRIVIYNFFWEVESWVGYVC